MEQVHQLEPMITWRELSIMLTDDDGIAVVHEQYLGKPGATDVVSFNYDPLPQDEGQRSGELIVNVQRAAEQGPLHDGVEHELAFYIAHGCHHLMGATDDTDAERAEMHRLETEWVEKAKSQKMLEGLFEENK